jgi:hypothetical protein
MECKKCGNNIEVGLVKNKKHGWVCVSCNNKLMFLDDKNARK